MNFEPIFDSPIHPGIARLAQYCQDLSEHRPLPPWCDFRPGSVRSILGFIFVIDVLHDKADYRYRLFGEHVSVLYGMDLTGKYLSEIGDENLRTLLRQTYDAVVAARSFQYLRGRYVWADQSVEIDRLLVPMADEEGNLTTLLGLTIPVEGQGLLAVRAGTSAAHLRIDDRPEFTIGAF